MTESEKIAAYCELLIKWNAKINLIGRATVTDIMERHVHDCLQLSEYLPDKEAKIVDLGTGAGLPGILLAIKGYKNITLIESDQKKCVFLREARRALNLECEILEARIEDIDNRKFDIIVSRAMASFMDLLNLSEPLLFKDSKCLFMKGQSYQDEIDQVSKSWNYVIKINSSKTGCGGVILEVQNISRI